MDKDEAHKQEPVRAWFTADEFVEMAERRTKEWAKQADIPDLIAGALGVSRGTAYDLMRDALKEAAPVQEPVAYRFKERPDDLRSAWRYVSKKQHVPHGWPYQSLGITGETK